jgi:hypothetical protein
VAVSHIVIVRRAPLAATAFAGGDQNKLIQRTRVRQRNKRPATYVTGA